MTNRERKWKIRASVLALFFAAHFFLQSGGDKSNTIPAGTSPITLDASCQGHGTTQWITCGAWSSTVTAGDAGVCYITGVSGGNNVTGAVVDQVNGPWDNVYGIEHPSTSTSWTATATIANMAASSPPPTAVFETAASSEGTINCYAGKSTATSNILDGGAVNQTQTATSTNPTSGTLATPTNNNEWVVAFMSRNSATAPSAGSGWTPTGTLTLVGTTNVRQASEYQIQTTATAVNGAFTATGSTAYADSQLAILPSGQTGGYRAFTGMYVPLGATGSAPSGTMSAALLGAAGSTLSSGNLAVSQASPYWTLNGTAPTYDSTVSCTGTRQILVQGIAHTFGDAGSMMNTTGAAGSSFFSAGDGWLGLGTPHYMAICYQMASAGATNSEQCDDWSLGGAATEPQMIVQAQYSSGTSYTLHLEGSENDGSAPSATLSTDTMYFNQLHLAGVSERYHQLFVSTKSGSTWSLASTLSMDVLCSSGANNPCTTPTAVATTTGTATSGSTALVVTSGTGIVVGQVVLGAGIPDPSQNGEAWTVVAAVAGTAVTLSQNTTAPLTGTTAAFYTPPAHFVAGTSCAASADSTALTCTTPGTGTIAVGDAVGGSGISQAATVTAVSLPSVTISIPTSVALSSGTGVTFWAVPSSSPIEFGKNAGGSCGITSTQWFSGPLDDSWGTWGQLEPN